MIPAICVAAGTIVPAGAQIVSLPYYCNDNSAFLTDIVDTVRVTTTGISSHFGSGGFCNYSNGETEFSVGAYAKSVYRLNDRVICYGLIDYNNLWQQKAAGSVFINPEDKPFDIVEEADTNRGTTNLERFHLVGKVAYNITPRFCFGAEIDYTAANYAKRKDARHANSLMDMNLGLGVKYNFPFVSLGAAYIYRRSNEGMKYSICGTTDVVYYSIISYGAFWGARELTCSEGFTDKNREIPLSDEYKGVDFQIDFSFWKLRIYNSAEWINRDGFFGKKSPYTISFECHDGKTFEYQSVVDFKQSSVLRHLISLGYNKKELFAYRNIYKIVSNKNGSTDVEYYDPLKISDKSITTLSAEYSLHWKGSSIERRMELSVGRTERVTNAFKYPFYRIQDINYNNLNALYSELYRVRHNEISYSIGGGFGSGNGTPFFDGVYVQLTEGQNIPPSQTLLLLREYDFLCSRRFSAQLGAKYSVNIKSDNIKPYILVDYTYTRSTNAIYCKRSRMVANCCIGLVF